MFPKEWLQEKISQREITFIILIITYKYFDRFEVWLGEILTQDCACKDMKQRKWEWFWIN